MAFVFLNHYLDIVDAVEDSDPSVVDNSIFEGTDVPMQYGLPERSLLDSEIHEEIKEWVLGASVGSNARKELKMDERSCYEASTVDVDGNRYPICIVSGW